MHLCSSNRSFEQLERLGWQKEQQRSQHVHICTHDNDVSYENCRCNHHNYTCCFSNLHVFATIPKSQQYSVMSLTTFVSWVMATSKYTVTGSDTFSTGLMNWLYWEKSLWNNRSSDSQAVVSVLVKIKNSYVGSKEEGKKVLGNILVHATFLILGLRPCIKTQHREKRVASMLSVESILLQDVAHCSPSPQSVR